MPRPDEVRKGLEESGVFESVCTGFAPAVTGSILLGSTQEASSRQSSSMQGEVSSKPSKLETYNQKPIVSSFPAAVLSFNRAPAWAAYL